MAAMFRDAALADIDLLVDFVRQYYLIDHIPFDAPAVRRVLGELLSDPSLGRVWVITSGDEPVGYAVLTLGYSVEYGGRDAFLDELYVQPSH